jgi:hypothetical protein
MNPIEIAQSIEVTAEPGSRFAIHVPTWFALLGLILTLMSVAGTAISLASLWAEFRLHRNDPWHPTAHLVFDAIGKSLDEAQTTQSSVEKRMDRIEQKLDQMERK